MQEPLVYLAISPALAGELSLEEQLPRLAAVARLEALGGAGQSAA